MANSYTIVDQRFQLAYDLLRESPIFHDACFFAGANAGRVADIVRFAINVVDELYLQTTERGWCVDENDDRQTAPVRETHVRK